MPNDLVALTVQEYTFAVDSSDCASCADHPIQSGFGPEVKIGDLKLSIFVSSKQLSLPKTFSIADDPTFGSEPVLFLHAAIGTDWDIENPQIAPIHIPFSIEGPGCNSHRAGATRPKLQGLEPAGWMSGSVPAGFLTEF